MITAQLSVRRGRAAIDFYKAAFGAVEDYRVGGTDAEPDVVAATEVSPVSDEHGWRLGRIADPFGHDWEIGKPLIAWPPSR